MKLERRSQAKDTSSNVLPIPLPSQEEELSAADASPIPSPPQKPSEDSALGKSLVTNNPVLTQNIRLSSFN